MTDNMLSMGVAFLCIIGGIVLASIGVVSLGEALIILLLATILIDLSAMRHRDD